MVVTSWLILRLAFFAIATIVIFALVFNDDWRWYFLTRKTKPEREKERQNQLENRMPSLVRSYLHHVRLYLHSTTDENQPQPDERFMRTIENEVGITEQGVNRFRKNLIMMIDAQDQIKPGHFTWKTLPQLKTGLMNAAKKGLI